MSEKKINHMFTFFEGYTSGTIDKAIIEMLEIAEENSFPMNEKEALLLIESHCGSKLSDIKKMQEEIADKKEEDLNEDIDNFFGGNK